MGHGLCAGWGGGAERAGSASLRRIVCDMHMPGINGATLLGRAQEQRPGTGRIVLSRHTELEATPRAMPVAHRFRSKPCDAEILDNDVERARNFGDDRVKEPVKVYFHGLQAESEKGMKQACP